MSTPTLEEGPPQHDTLGDPEWPSQVHARSVRLRPLTALLAVVLVAVAGIWGGAELQKRHGGGSSANSSTGLAALASRFGRGTGRAGAGGFAGGGFAGGGAAAGGATTGTVTEVTKKLLYLTSSTGALVKISLTPKTTFTRTSNKPNGGGLALGDTAIVIGAKNAAGTVVATSVIATQKGVTATRGGFGGAGGFGGGAAAGG